MQVFVRVCLILLLVVSSSACRLGGGAIHEDGASESAQDLSDPNVRFHDDFERPDETVTDSPDWTVDPQ